MKVIPFSNGTEGMIWMDNNCDSCMTKCYFLKNMSLGFVTGDITIKTAESIGIATKYINSNYVDLYLECQHKNKYKKKKRPLKDQLKLF